jgi:site-specific DNA-methyltransferase (adenine-specific)
MKSLPDKSIDLFVCDLPYGVLTNKKGAMPTGRNTHGIANAGCDWDVKLDLVALWREIERLCRNEHTPVLMFCNARFGVELVNSKPDWFRYDLIWDKEVGVSFLSANKMPLRCHELIYVFSKKSAFYKRIDEFKEGMIARSRKTSNPRGANFLPSSVGISQPDNIQQENMRCSLSIIRDRLDRYKSHPTAKSITLYKWLISRYSNEGDTVLDPTAGSFNSGRACAELNRNYIGIEKDEKFYNANKIEKIEMDFQHSAEYSNSNNKQE